MRVGYVYKITLGSHTDKYLCTALHGVPNAMSFELRRVRLPKTKIDAVRLPEHIQIFEWASYAITNKKNKKCE